jgi:cytochrome P450
MHRRPDLYGMDAELFRPERWDEEMPLSRNETDAKWGYLPFNGGPRICLGSELFAFCNNFLAKEFLESLNAD